jgi:hypothetical protein
MKKKIKKLYSENFDDFVRLLKLYYGVDEDGMVAVLQDYYKKNEFFFVVDGSLFNLESIITDITETAKKLKLFKQFDLM